MQDQFYVSWCTYLTSKEGHFNGFFKLRYQLWRNKSKHSAKEKIVVHLNGFSIFRKLKKNQQSKTTEYRHHRLEEENLIVK